MPEAVIVSAARSPIGRANKGSLKDLRPDDLAATIVQDRARQGAGARPEHVDDLYLGCGLPGGEQGFNMARVVNVLNGHGRRARRDDHPLLLLVGADHPDGLPRDQGRRGRRRSSPPASRRCPASPRAPPTTGPTPRTRSSTTPSPAPTTTAEGGQDWHDPREDGNVPDVYIAMGQTAENVARLRGLSREELDEFGVRSQNLAEKAIADGFWAREITPVTTPDGTVVSADDGPRAGRHLSRRPPSSSRSSAPTASSPPATAARSTTAPPRSSSCPTPRPPSSASPRWRGSSRPASAASRPRSWASARSRRPSGPWPTPA